MKNSANSCLFFYQGDKLVTLQQGDVSRTIFRTPDLPLAEQRTAGDAGTGLLATDDKGSVLTVQETDEKQS